MKELVILDLDGVIISGQSQQALLNFLFKKGFISPFFYFKVCLWFILYKLGLVKNPQKIMEYAFGFLKGKSIDEVDKITDEFFNNVLQKFIFPEMTGIIKEHYERGRELIIISNSVDIIVKRVANFLGIKNYIGTKLEIIDKRFTGKIFGKIVYAENKVNLLKEFIQNNNLNLENSFAYTDHISDLTLLEVVSHAYAVNPDKKLLFEAKKRNWQILNFKK